MGRRSIRAKWHVYARILLRRRDDICVRRKCRISKYQRVIDGNAPYQNNDIEDKALARQRRASSADSAKFQSGICTLRRPYVWNQRGERNAAGQATVA